MARTQVLKHTATSFHDERGGFGQNCGLPASMRRLFSSRCFCFFLHWKVLVFVFAFVFAFAFALPSVFGIHLGLLYALAVSPVGARCLLGPDTMNGAAICLAASWGQAGWRSHPGSRLSYPSSLRRLRCTSNSGLQATRGGCRLRKRLEAFAAAPHAVQQHGQFAGHRHQGSFLPSLAARGRQF